MSRVAQSLVKGSAARFYSTAPRFVKVKSFQASGNAAIGSFNALEPVVFKQSFNDIPAIGKWFTLLGPDASTHGLNIAYLEKYGGTMVSIEVTRPVSSSSSSTTFERIEAPLSVLLAYMGSFTPPETRIYLAQHSLDDLPTALRADLPAPVLLTRLGRGDIYASSLWMGKAPTRTPLHRDPNPNMFVQLAGKKTVRMMRPETGRAVYERVRREVGKQSGGANMRFEDMMEGEEVERLETAIWDIEDDMRREERGVEADLESGDGLYIPLGWWHAVRGLGSGANASVNWWFR